MSRDLEIGIRLTADGKALIGETQNAKQALGGLGDAGQKASGGLGQAAKQSDALEASASRLKTGLVAAAGAYLSLGAAIAGGKAVMDAAIANERLYNSLTVGLGSLKAAKDEMGFLRQESDRLGLQLDTTAQQYTKLVVSAKGTRLEGQAIRDIFIGVAQASTVLGLSAADTGGVLTAVEQIISKGKVSAEELRGQLGERLPGAFQMAARAINVTTAELDAMLVKGDLTAEQLLPALALELNKTFGPQAEQAAQGLNAQINRFNTALYDLKVAIGATGLIDFLSSGIQLATRMANALSGVFGVSANASAIDQQRQMIAGLRADLASLNDRKNVPLIGELLFDRQQADLLNQRIDDAVADLVKMEQAVTVESAALGAQQQALTGVTQSLGTNTETKKTAISEATRFIQALTKEIESVGKDAFELKRLEAAKLGVLQTAGPLIDALERETNALEAQAKQTRQREDDLRKIAQVTESVATAEEKHTARVKELDYLLSQGLGQESYNRALKQAEEQFLKTGKAGRNAFDEISQYSIQAQRNLQNALGDALFDGINGRFDEMVDGFVRAIQQMVTQALAADILGALFNKPSSNMAALFGALTPTGGAGVASGAAGNALNMASLGSSAMSLYQGGFGASSLFNSFALSGMGRGLGLSAQMGGSGMSFLTNAGSGLSAGIGRVAGPAMIAFAATQLFKSFAGDKRLGGGFGNALNTIGDIPILGDFMPVVPLVNMLFGRGPLKQKETNLIGDITAGGFSGITSTKFKAQGGLMRGDKVDRVMLDTDTGQLLDRFGSLVEGGISGVLEPFADQAKDYALELGQHLDASISGMTKSLRGMADTLGIGAQVLDDFSMSVNIASEKGKSLTEEQIGQVIADAGDQMARNLIPEIDSLTHSGESAFQTLQRLTGEFDVLTSLGAALGYSLADTRAFLKSVSFSDRSAFVDQAGGTDALAQSVAFFSQNFLTEAEQLAPAIETVNTKMAELGLSGIKTKEQFRDIVKAQDLTTESGQKMFLQLMGIQEAFLAVAEASGAAAENQKILDDALEKAQYSAQRRAELEARARKEARQAEAEHIKAEAAAALRNEALALRESLLLAGDAAALLSNELKISDGLRPESYTDKNGQFNAGAFNAAYATLQAGLAKDLMGQASANALRIQDVGALMSSLYRTMTSDEVIKPIYLSIRDAIVDGSGDLSNQVRDAVSGFAGVMALAQARRNYDGGGVGLAGVRAARRDLNFTSASGFAGGRMQFGADVVAYGQAIDELGERLESGKITAEQHAAAMSEMNRVMGSNAGLLNDVEAQMERISKASYRLGKAGLESIGFYFNDLTKQTRALAQSASAAGEPIAKATEAIGRLKSISQVFGESAAAVVDGFGGAGKRGAAILAQESRPGSKTSRALLIAEAAAIAGQVITTADAARFAQKLASDKAFADTSTSGLRDISLLLDGLSAFDPQSFENAFLRINEALASGRINEQQYSTLFNTALDAFEGLDDAAGGVKGAFGQLRDAARSLADELLLDEGLSTLNSRQSLVEAQRQFDVLMARAKGGDASAAGELSGTSRDLLRIARDSVSNKADYDFIFGKTVAELRDLEGVGPVNSSRLDVQPVVEELKLLREEVKRLREENNQGNRSVASGTTRTRRKLEEWSANGMPATEV